MTGNKVGHIVMPREISINIKSMILLREKESITLIMSLLSYLFFINRG